MLAEFIEQQRKKRGFTQQDLASELGMSRPTYAQLERGERDITVAEAEMLASIFGLSLENFLCGIEPRIELHVEKQKHAQGQDIDIRISVPQQRLDKFKQVLLYILKKVGGKPNIGMTAIYKLLYFIDFDYYEKYEEQLIGLIYIKNHFGPTPVEFKKVIDKLLADNEIELIKSKYYRYQQKKYLINPEIEPDLSILNGREKEHIDWELRRLSDLSGRALSELSHKDVPWLSAEDRKPIDYESVFYRTPDTSVRDYSDGEID